MNYSKKLPRNYATQNDVKWFFKYICGCDILKFGTPKLIAVIYLEVDQFGFTS